MAVPRLLTGRSAQFVDSTGGSESLEQARAIGDEFTGGNVYWDAEREVVIGTKSSDTNEHFLRIYSDKTLDIEVIDASSIGSDSPRKISIQQGGTECWSFRQDGKFEVATEGINFNGDIIPLTDASKLIGDSAHRINKVAAATGYEVYLSQSDTYPMALYTLAGVFLDRDAERFAYTSLAPWLFWIAALGLLLAVSARRLTAPEGLEQVWGAFRAPRPQQDPALSPALGPEPQTRPTAVGALRRVRGRKAAPPVDEPPPSVPRFSRPPPLPTTSPAPQLARQPRSAARIPATPGAPTGPAPRQPTAAEILLARRRGRKS